MPVAFSLGKLNPAIISHSDEVELTPEVPETPAWSRVPEHQEPPIVTASSDSGSDGGAAP